MRLIWAIAIGVLAIVAAIRLRKELSNEWLLLVDSLILWWYRRRDLRHRRRMRELLRVVYPPHNDSRDWQGQFQKDRKHF